MNYLGHPVLEDFPNEEEPRGTFWARRLYRLDPGPGAVHVRDRAGVGVPAHNGFAWLLRGRAEITAFRAWLAERRGQLAAFWAPTWRRDLLLAQAAGSSDTALVIQECGYSEHVFPQPARQHLAIRLGGAFYLRRVLSAVKGSGTETLTLEASLGVAAPLGTLISYLTLVRLAADEVELAWQNSDLVSALADFVEVPEDPLRLPVTAAMLSHSGLSSFTASLVVNGDLDDNAWDTDAAVAGATLTADLGQAWAMRRASIYAQAASYAGSYSLRYSDDGSAWFAALTGFVPAKLGRNDAAWPDAGAHRWWQLFLENAPGAGPWLSELELYTR